MKKHILLVSEDAAFRFTSGLTLVWDGHKTSEARDYMEAVALIKLHQESRQPIGLLVTMFKDPRSFILLIEALESCDISIPVLSFSNLFKPSIYPFFSGGCSGVAAKLIKSGDLLQCVNQFLGRREVSNDGRHV
jgi:hypothetical protein